MSQNNNQNQGKIKDDNQHGRWISTNPIKIERVTKDDPINQIIEQIIKGDTNEKKINTKEETCKPEAKERPRSPENHGGGGKGAGGIFV